MKVFSQTFSTPLTSNELENKQLQETLFSLIQRQERIMQQKLIKQEETQQRIKKLQQEYAKNLEKKYAQWQGKLAKGQKNKTQILQKIVKRCKQNDKIYNSKVKNAFVMRKQSMRQAWKAANQFNQKIHDPNYVSTRGKKNANKNAEKKQLSANPQDQQMINQSVMITDHQQAEKQKCKQSSPLIKNASNIYNNSFMNRTMQKSKDTNVLLKSVNNPQKQFDKSVRINRQEHQFLMTQPNRNDQRQQNMYEQKLRRTLLRHHQRIASQQSKRIQQMGERLNKISKSRVKRNQLNKSRFNKNKHDQDGQVYRTYMEDIRNADKDKKPIKPSQRIKSQSHSYERVKKVTNWSDINKHRREQLLQMHIESGNQYLQANKIRHLKGVLSKNVTYCSIEKKLYQERFKH